MSGSLSEFELIEHYFQALGPDCDELELGPGDDCAVVQVPAGMSLCLSVDAMVEGVHFPIGASGELVAYRALAAAVSDLAAMGAKPSHFTMALTLPCVDHVWLDEFARSLAAAAFSFEIALVGGDTTQGPLSVAIQVHGIVPAGSGMRRSCAQVGDLLVVSGTLGDAAAALHYIDQQEPSAQQLELLTRYQRPQPRLHLGQALREYANSCIDVSDGLLADAGHVAKASRCQLEIQQQKVPMSAALKHCAGEAAMSHALSGGDDYELLFTISASNFEAFKRVYPEYLLTVIGQVVPGCGGVVLKHMGREITMLNQGYQHFA